MWSYKIAFAVYLFNCTLQARRQGRIFFKIYIAHLLDCSFELMRGFFLINEPYKVLFVFYKETLRIFVALSSLIQ